MADTDIPEGKDIKPMGFLKSIAIDGVTWAIPAIVLALIGGAIGSTFDQAIGVALVLVAAWSGLLFYFGFMVIPEQHFVVVERLGRFHSVKYHGPRWKNPFFDREKLRESFPNRDFSLYSDVKTAEIDFTDASAPIKAKVWYSIANPVDVANKNWKEVTRQITLWTYRYNNPRERAAAIVDGALRPLLQAKSIDEAQVEGDAICEAAMIEARPIMAGIGAYPSSQKALIIEDIDLPQALLDMRSRRLQGEAEADAQTKQSQGLARAVEAVISAAKAEGRTVPHDEAYQMVRDSKILDMLSTTGANISFVASDIEGVIKTIAVNGGKGK